MPDWDFRVQGVAGPKHPRAKVGEFLGETGHKGISSLQLEVQVWQARCKRGDALHFTIIDCRRGGKMTMLRADHNTEINWSEAWRTA